MGLSLNQTATKFLEAFRSTHEPPHSAEIQSLQSILQVSQLSTNPIVTATKKRKFDVAMSAAAYSVLKTFLDQRRLMIITRLINSLVTIKSTTRDSAICDMAASGGGLIVWLYGVCVVLWYQLYRVKR